MKKYWSIVLLLLINSCIKIDVLSNEVPKYAVISLISPTDSLITAFISKVSPIGDEIKTDELIVKNAVVKIISENETIALAFNAKQQRYEFSKNGFIKFNKKYQLIINIPDEKVLKSECSINSDTELFYESVTKDENYELKVNWLDNPIEDNYYAISARYFQKDSLKGILEWNSTRKTYTEVDDKEAINNRILVNGFIKNISKLKKPLILNILFSNIDKRTNNFFNARNKQYNQSESLQQSIEQFVVQASKNNTQLSDFFERFKEPVILPTSNIENGLGFFGGYYSKTKQIVIN